MTEEQIDELVDRYAGGEGFEAILASMVLNSDISVAQIRAHPNAGTRLKDAKGMQRTAQAAKRIRLAAASKQIVS